MPTVCSRRTQLTFWQCLVKGDATSNKSVRSFFDNLRSEYSAEFFESVEKLHEHYLEDNEWASQKGATPKPAQLIHNAKLINDRRLFESMLEDLRGIVEAGADSTDYDELCRLLMAS